MSTKQEIVDRSTDGFRRSDHDAILGCLTDDVLWQIHGRRTLEAGHTIVVTGEGVSPSATACPGLQ